MKRRKIDILGMAETRHRGKEEGRDLGDGYVLIYSGVEFGTRKHGVALMLGPKLSPYVQKVRLVNERLMNCTLRIKNQNFNIYQVYAPQQGHTQEEKDNFMELLDTHLEEGSEGVNILIGDFNARVGCDRTGIEEVIGRFGEETRNQEGENLIDFCLRNHLKIMNGFFVHQESHKYTRYRWNQISGQFDQKSVIDYIIVSDKRMVNNVKVIPGESLDSDHRLVVGDLKTPEIRTQKKEKRKIIKIENLDDEEKKARYQNSTTQRLQSVNQEDRNWNVLSNIVREAGEEELGCRYVGGTRKRQTPWWNEEVESAVKNKNAQMRKWLKFRNQETRENYVRARNNAEAVKRRSKIEVATRLGETLQEDLRGNKKKVFGMAKAYRKEKTRQHNIKDENGHVIAQAEQLNEKWTEYFRELLNVAAQEDDEDGEYQFQYDVLNRQEDFIRRQEFEEALKEMKNGKSPGCDGIPIELFKEGGDLAKECLYHLVSDFWLDSEIAEDWGKMITLPLFKGKGDSSICSNYRGITLICHAAKLYERILEKRARCIIEPKLGEEQYGYRKNRSTSDLIFALRMITEKSWEFNRPLYVAFIDLEKAFDSVPRYKLWKCLDEEYEVNGRLGAAIQSTYKPCIANVRTGYENKNWFQVKTGVKQGSVLSPLLFIAYMDIVIKKFKERMHISGDVMIFADDVAFWTYDKEELERGLLIFNECLCEAGLKMNISKTEILTVSKNPNEQPHVEMRGTNIRNVETFKYLGCIFTDKGYSNKAEITERITKYNRCASAVYPIITDRYIPVKAKVAIFEGLLTPIMTYGSESWTLTSKDRSRVQATEMRTLRTIAKRTRRDKIRNVTIRNQLGVASMMSKIEKGQLRWLGHLERMNYNRTAKQRWVWRPDGRRSRGRPRKRWSDGVEEILQKHNLPNLEELRERGILQDRTEWKKMLISLTG